ncbi:MAG TPA: enolase C-terminal domain-like protein [Burkholderiaceae bacterium]
MSAELPKISPALVRKVIVPFEQPLRTASGVMQAAPMVVLDIPTSAGIVGHSYLFCYTPTVLDAVARLAQDVSNALIDQPLAPHQLLQRLRSNFKLLGTVGLLDMVLSAIDMALWDAWSKFLGQPLAALLGADFSHSRSMPVYASYGMEDVQQTRRNIEQAMSEGHRYVKIKIGHPELATDLAIVETALESMQGKASLLVDYNQSLSVAEALVRCKALDTYDLAWIEEPTCFDDLQGHAQIARHVTTPIQVGENLWGPTQIAASLDANASDLMMPDLGKVGGIGGWLQASAVCAARRIPVSNHFYQEISAHLMLVTPGAHLLEYFKMADPILEQPLELIDGRAYVPDRPGHGMAWREKRIQTFLV